MSKNLPQTSLKDIAKMAGVSISTVSRVLNNDSVSSASYSTKQKILKIASELNYHPNKAAQQLKKSNCNKIDNGLIYCLVAPPIEETKEDPFYNILIQIMQIEALKCDASLAFTFYSPDIQDDTLIRSLFVHPAEMAVILGRFDNDFYLLIKKLFNRIIYIGLNELPSKCDQIVCNGYAAIYEATKYLYSLGHRNIGFIGVNEGRYAGFLKACKDLNIDNCVKNVIITDILSMKQGLDSAHLLISRNREITSIVCANDILSIGALKACKEEGLLVPTDISLIGMNDIENIQYTFPMLSSMRVPLEAMGKTAIRALIYGDRNRHIPIKMYFPYELVKRGSCSDINDNSPNSLYKTKS